MNTFTTLNTFTNIPFNQALNYTNLPAICQPINTPILVSFDNLSLKNIGSASNTTTLVNPARNRLVLNNNVFKFGGSSLQITMVDASSNNYLAINSFVFQPNGFSMACWFYYTSIPSATYSVIFLSDVITSYNRNYVVGFFSTNTTTLRVAVGWKPSVFSNLYQDIPIGGTGNAIQPNTWCHIGMSISSGGVVTLVINGVQVTWTVGNCLYFADWLAGKTTNFCVGTSSYIAPIGMNGYVDQLRMYNSVLTVSDFNTIYTNGC